MNDSIERARALAKSDMDVARKLGELANDTSDMTVTLFILTMQSLLLCSAQELSSVSDELEFRRGIDSVGKEGE